MIKEKIIDNSQVGVRSHQSMPFTWQGSTDFGILRPFHWQELVPTDKVLRCRPRIEVQMLPLASPTFQEMSLYVHYFFVPTRLIWAASKDFFSGEGLYSLSAPPYIRDIDFNIHFTDLNPRRAAFKHCTSLGIPPYFFRDVPAITSSFNPSALPFRAYRQIWWDFYRDPEVLRDALKSQYLFDNSGQVSNEELDSLLLPMPRMITDTWHAQVFASSGASPVNQRFGQTPNITALNTKYNVSSTAETSQQLRLIEALTRMAERYSLSGKRQIDQLYSRYGVKPEFDKLQMCQYLGGSKANVLVSDITATADTLNEAGTVGSPLGFKQGAGYCAFDDLNIEFTAEEHGYLMGIFSVVPKVRFVQGLGRQWIRRNRDDFFRKELEHTGLVAIPKSEVALRYENSPLYVDDDNALTYAFTQPYYDYKRNVDIISGDFLTYHAVPSGEIDNQTRYMQSMDSFVDFPANRNFNSSNMVLDPAPYNKVFFYLGGSGWSNSDDHFHINVNMDILIDRPMDGFAVPTIETTENPHASKSPVGGDVTL